MTDKEKELAEELERSRDDVGEWSDEPVEIDVRPGRSQVVSFRLPLEELEVLTEMAATTGESLSDFIRSAIGHRVRHVTAPSVYVTHTATMMTVRQAPSTSGHNEPDPFYVSELGRVASAG